MTGCGGSGKAGPPPVDEARCTELRDHLVELRLNASRTEDLDRGQHRTALVAALGTGFVGQCVNFTTDKEANCILAATDEAAATRCA